MSSSSLPLGFTLATASAGFKKSGRADLSLVLSETAATAAGVFTANLFKAAPVVVSIETLKARKTVRAVVVNTGQANACTGEEGLANCLRTRSMLSGALGIDAEDILPASTGVIGAQMKMDLWEKAVPKLAEGLGKASLEDLASAMMTTDAFPKFATATRTIQGKTVTLAGVAKGAGMICPNMATMISTVLCDASINHEDWQKMFVSAVDKTFNRVTVDGDTSTNDTLFGLANGASGVVVSGPDLAVLEEALVEILGQLAYLLVKDGEGSTKVLHITVTGTENDGAAEQAARTVGHSQLVKTAMYGKDPNWGRIVAALGRSGVSFDPMDVVVSMCGVTLFKKGQPTPEDFDKLLKEPLSQYDVTIDISLGSGKGTYTLLASDLGHEYISVNADYRS